MPAARPPPHSTLPAAPALERRQHQRQHHRRHRPHRQLDLRHIAAVELGFFAAEGLEVEHQLIFPTSRRTRRCATVTSISSPVRRVPSFSPSRNGEGQSSSPHGAGNVLAAGDALGSWSDAGRRRRGQGPAHRRGAARQRRLKRLLIDAGVDLDRDGVRIVGVPGTNAPGVSFGVAAAQALEEGKLDGFWANAMGAENAVRRGVGRIVLDVRRGLGPAAAFHYTMPVLSTSDQAIARDRDKAAAAVRAIVQVQRALKADVSLATKVGRALFPPAEAELIAAVVERDLPFYDPAITPAAVDGLNRFAQAIGLLEGAVSTIRSSRPSSATCGGVDIGH